MFNKTVRNFFVFILLIAAFSVNIYSMEGRLFRKYPYDHNKTTFEEFSKTEEGKKFLASSKHELRPMDLWIFGDVEISDNLQEIVYKTSPDEVKDLIEKYKLGFLSKDSKPLVKSIFLHGKTGTGKTEIVRMIAKRIDIKLISINTSLLGNSYEDSDFINLKETILPLIKSGKSYIVALEGFDSLRIKSIDWLYSVIGSENILFIFISNKNVDSLDKRFRSSQICKEIEVKLPDENRRGQIIGYRLTSLKKNLIKGKESLDYDSLDFKEIAETTNNFNISNLIGLLNRVYSHALRKAWDNTVPGNIVEMIITKKMFYNKFNEVKKTREHFGAIEDENI